LKIQNTTNKKFNQHKSKKNIKQVTRTSYQDIPVHKRKYRISIVESMSDEKVLQYGFEKSYYLFEKSINRMQKSGDVAEQAAINYLLKQNLLSDNYKTNRVISLSTIKIEADIIDYDNKIIYETKSRKSGLQAKMAIKKKWAIFEFDKENSRYHDFTLKGIVVSNYDNGMKIKGIADFTNDTHNRELVKAKFDSHYKRIEKFRNMSVHI